MGDRVVVCAVAYSVGGRWGAVGWGDVSDSAGVNVCGVWVGKRFIV